MVKNLAFSVLLAAILVSILFWPALGGGYLLDDAVNLTNNSKVQLLFGDADFWSRAWNAGIASDLGRPVSMLSFALEHALVGEFDPRIGKLINLGIHLLNALLLVLLVRALAGLLFRQGVLNETVSGQLKKWAVFLAFLWAILPSQVSSVMYVIQRMNLLAVLFSLAAMALYFWQREREFSLPVRAILLIASLSLLGLGVLSKENAVLAVVFLIGFELLVWYRRHIPSYRKAATLLILAMLGALILVVPWWAESKLASAYALRPFDWSERLLLQPLAILWYTAAGFLPLLVTPRFYMDFLQTPAYLAMPWDAWLALFIVVGLLGWLMAGLLRSASLLLYFSLGWFFVFHLVESSFWPLEIAFLHRNYLPSAGLVIGVAFLCLQLGEKYPAIIKPLTMGVAVYTLFIAAATVLESIRWSSAYTLSAVEAEDRPVSPRSTFSLGAWYLANDPANLFCEQMDTLFESTRDQSLNNISGHYGQILADERCRGVITEAMLVDIQRILGNEPLAASSLQFLDLLTDRCSVMDALDCRRLHPLAQAALANPRSTSGYQVEFGMVLAKIAYYSGEIDLAISAAQRVIELRPDYLQAHLMMMDVMYSSNNCQGVLAAQDLLSASPLLYLIERDIQPLDERYPRCLGSGME